MEEVNYFMRIQWGRKDHWFLDGTWFQMGVWFKPPQMSRLFYWDMSAGGIIELGLRHEDFE